LKLNHHHRTHTSSPVFRFIVRRQDSTELTTHYFPLFWSVEISPDLILVSVSLFFTSKNKKKVIMLAWLYTRKPPGTSTSLPEPTVVSSNSPAANDPSTGADPWILLAGDEDQNENVDSNTGGGGADKEAETTKNAEKNQNAPGITPTTSHNTSGMHPPSPSHVRLGHHPNALSSTSNTTVNVWEARKALMASSSATTSSSDELKNESTVGVETHNNIYASLSEVDDNERRDPKQPSTELVYGEEHPDYENPNEDDDADEDHETHPYFEHEKKVHQGGQGKEAKPFTPGVYISRKTRRRIKKEQAAAAAAAAAATAAIVVAATSGSTSPHAMPPTSPKMTKSTIPHSTTTSSSSSSNLMSFASTVPAASTAETNNDNSNDNNIIINGGLHPLLADMREKERSAAKLRKLEARRAGGKGGDAGGATSLRSLVRAGRRGAFPAS
jgi:hypothetical protein